MGSLDTRCEIEVDTGLFFNHQNEMLGMPLNLVHNIRRKPVMRPLWTADDSSCWRAAATLDSDQGPDQAPQPTA
jgi:hypothetical protein